MNILGAYLEVVPLSVIQHQRIFMQDRECVEQTFFGST